MRRKTAPRAYHSRRDIKDSSDQRYYVHFLKLPDIYKSVLVVRKHTNWYTRGKCTGWKGITGSVVWLVDFLQRDGVAVPEGKKERFCQAQQKQRKNRYKPTLKQSCIKQQTVYSHWPPDFPKQGVKPSAIWIAWISSVFFILPGIIPRALAFFLISGIFRNFSNTFTGAIFLIPLLLCSMGLCPLGSF